MLAAACGNEGQETAPVAQATGQGPVANAGAALVPIAGPERHILAFGDSLFAGYNVAPDESYPARLEAALRGQGINARVTNAGVSGDTSAAGAQRFAFTLDNLETLPDLLILELGGNDLLRGLSPAQTRANLAAMIEQAQARDIDVLLMGMRAPANMGRAFVDEFNALYSDLAKQYGVDFIPFWVEAVADRPDLIQPDRIHPTAEGIEVLVSETLDKVIKALPEEPE